MSGTLRICEQCKGTILADEIAQREAGLIKGQLLCPKCVAAVRRAAIQAREAAGDDQAQASGQSVPATATAVDQESISLVGEDEAPRSGTSKIRNLAEAGSLAGTHHDENLKRPLTGPTEAPTRCRTFHSKLNDSSLAYMNDQINEWIDGDPRVFIKTVSTTVGTFEGKHPEPHLFVTMFY